MAHSFATVDVHILWWLFQLAGSKRVRE